MARSKKTQEPETEQVASTTAAVNTAAEPVSITFTGDPRGGHNPAVADFHGKAFPLNKAVTVDDKAWLAAHGHRVRRNNHFKVD